jgi:hypothetical protein
MDKQGQVAIGMQLQRAVRVQCEEFFKVVLIKVQYWINSWDMKEQ